MQEAADIFPQSSHHDPHSIPYHELPKGGGAPWKVTLLHCGYLHSERLYWADDAWEKDEKKREAKRQSPYSLPITYSLLSRGDEHYLWDLGYDPDNDRLPKILGRADLPRDFTPLKMLAKLGIKPESLTGAVLSHLHVDHYGRIADYPTTMPLYCGEGALEWANGGDEAEGGLAGFPTAYLKGGWKFNEIGDNCSLRKTSIGPFAEAWDFFGDSSAFIVKAEGHCPAHVAMICKTGENTSTGENEWAFLGGDVAHSGSLWMPIPPSPYSVDQDRRSVPGQFKFTPDATTFSCMQDFPDKAFKTFSALTRLEMEDNIIVLPAHEAEAIEAVGLKPGGTYNLNNWKKDGLKEKKHELGRQTALRLSQL